MSNRFQQFLEQTNDLMARKFELDLFSPLSGRIFGLLLFAPEPVSLQKSRTPSACPRQRSVSRPEFWKISASAAR